VISLEYRIAAKCSFLIVPGIGENEVSRKKYQKKGDKGRGNVPETATTRGMTGCPPISLTNVSPVHAVRTCSRATRMMHSEVVGE
jgi:hypothetical protein